MQQQHTNQQEYSYQQPQVPAQPSQPYANTAELHNTLSMSSADGAFSQRIQSPPPPMDRHNMNSYSNSQQVSMQPMTASGPQTKNPSPVQENREIQNWPQNNLEQVQREVEAFAAHAATKDEFPCYHGLKEIQEQIHEQFSAFPMQQNSDFFDANWPAVIKKAAHQLEFLFMKLQIKAFNSPLEAVHKAHTMDSRDGTGLGPNPSMQSQPNILDQNYNNLVNENGHDIQMLRNSLGKADEIVKNLRIENEYFQRQLDTLRQDAETAKQREREAVQRETISRDTLALERESFMQREQQMQRELQRPYSHGRSEKEYNMTLSNSYEPQGHIPQPMPHPQPILIHEFGHEPPSFKKSPRRISAGVTKARATSNGTAGVGRHTKFETRQLRQRDENQLGRDRSREPEGANADEVRSLKFELQQQAEMLMLKTEAAKNLQTQLDQQKRRMGQDASKLQEQLKVENDNIRKELDTLKDCDAQKEAQIAELRKQCTELVQSKGIEMNLLVTKPGLVEAKKATEAEGKKLVKSRTAAASGPLGKGSKNLQFAMDINREMELMLGEGELDMKPKKNKKKKQNAQKEGLQLPDSLGYQNVQDLLLPEILLQNQIQAAQLADSLIDELKCTEQSHDSQVMELKTTCESMKVHSETMDEQKKFLNEKVNELSKENDNLKQKFSALLDQFQEYVTMQESKQATDQEKQKHQQETLLQNMQDNIKELEHVTEGLQNELQHKESVFELLKKENKDLELKLNAKSQEDVDNQKQAMVRLEEEISFLKRHHEIEINMLKQQYERSIETAKMIGQESYQQNQVRSAMQQELENNRVTLGNDRDTIRLSQDNIPLAEPNRNQYTMQQDSTIYHPNHQASMNTSTQGHYHGAHGLNGTPPSKQRVKDIISTTQHTFDKMKKDMSEKEQIIEEKNREILKLRMQNEEIVQRYGRSASQPGQPHIMSGGYGQLDGERRRQLVSDLSYLVDQLRSELTRVKQGFFVQIGKQIHFEPTKQYQSSNALIMSEEGLESEVLIQLAEIRALIALVTEIGMLSSNANGGNPPEIHTRSRSRSPQQTSQAPTMPVGGAGLSKNFHDSNYQIKRNADNLLRQNHASGLHELLMEQISRSETLMQDNALMQRSLYKYETTLAELDVILRGEQRDQAIFELKKLVENQLKQIVSLQQESEPGRGVSPVRDQSPLGGARPMMQPSSDPRELEALRGQLKEQRAANEELLSERRNLMDLVQNLEEQVKEGHKNLEKNMDRVTVFEKEISEKVAEVEDIRKRITKVAELFERKEIKQKYSFEVLCDFIHDKAKRLFTKYENVSKERKIMQEEKNFYFQRKLDQLEQENFAMKETQRAAERVIQELIPSLSDLLDRPILQSHELSEYYYARQVLEQVEAEFCQLRKAQAVLQERNGELMRQAEALKTELRLRGPPANVGSPSQESRYSPLQQQTSAPMPVKLQPSMGSQSRINPHQQHSPFEQKLQEARAQEQAEIAGRGGARTPNSSSSPLRHPAGQPSATEAHRVPMTAHDRTKSMERDNKDSPTPGSYVNSTSAGNMMMGGHLASGNLRNDRNRDLSQ